MISSITPASSPCRTALAPPAMVTVSSPAASIARSIASSKLVTKWNVVPPSISTGSCGWWVSTKTGAWYGGSSPHQPRHISPPWASAHSPRSGAYMLRPIT